MNCRKYGYTDIKLLLVHDLSDTTVLRFSFLGDIHTSDDLDTGHYSRQKPGAVGHPLIEGTVDPVTDSDLAFHGLYMNIGSPLSHSLLDHTLNQLNYRRVLDIFIIFFILGRYGSSLHLLFLCVGICHAGDLGTSVSLIQCLYYGSRGGDHRLYLHVGHYGKVVYGVQIHGIHHGDHQHIRPLGIYRKRYGIILLCHLALDHAGDILRHFPGGKVHHVEVKLIRQSACYLLLCTESLFNQGVTETLTFDLRLMKGFIQLFGRDHTLLGQNVTQSHFSAFKIHKYTPLQ